MTSENAPTLLAMITGTGGSSTVPDRADAVDADIQLAGGKFICSVTLLNDETTDELDIWGSPDMWCSDYAALCETEFTAGDVVQAVRDAVEKAAAS